MRLMHFFLTLTVILIWGLNFIAVSIGLQDFPPVFLVALRLFLISIPAVFFIKKPDIPWRLLFGYGITMFGLQFSLLFMGMHLGVTPGLASLLHQTQVFFSIIFAVVFLKEKLSPWQLIGAVLSFTGIGYIASHVGGEVTLWGFLLVFAAAASWGVGNLLSKKIKNVNTIALICWASLLAWPFVLVMSLWMEGPAAILQGLQQTSLSTVLSLLYLIYISTFLGYFLWTSLLRQLPLSSVAPFTLLIPVVGLLSSALIFGEPMPLWKVLGSGLVMAGLGLSIIAPRLMKQTPRTSHAPLRKATL